MARLVWCPILAMIMAALITQLGLSATGGCERRGERGPIGFRRPAVRLLSLFTIESNMLHVTA